MRGVKFIAGTQPRFSNVQHVYAIQENGIVDWSSFSTDIGVLYCEVGTTFMSHWPLTFSAR
jgi:hypothetical protein